MLDVGSDSLGCYNGHHTNIRAHALGQAGAGTGSQTRRTCRPFCRMFPARVGRHLQFWWRHVERGVEMCTMRSCKHLPLHNLSAVIVGGADCTRIDRISLQSCKYRHHARKYSPNEYNHDRICRLAGAGRGSRGRQDKILAFWPCRPEIDLVQPFSITKNRGELLIWAYSETRCKNLRRLA